MRRRTLLSLPLGGLALRAEAARPDPPAGHPRLYVRSADLEIVRKRVRHPLHAGPLQRLRTAAGANPGGATIARAAEIARSKALLCLLEDNEQAGRDAIRILSERLPGAAWDLDIQDISREIGLVMLSGAMVYDWCFPLLDEATRGRFIEQIERLARMLEVGYPPVRQSSITSHTGEAMLMRDMIGAGIAIFDEQPVMWRVSADRLFEEMIPARNFFYPSHSHHQGNAYGPYRFRWEILNAWILKRLTGKDYYDPSIGQVPYHWLYTRLPNGTQMQEGDMFLSNDPTPAWFLTASYFRDPILQGAFLGEPRATRLDPIEHLLFGDPEIEPEPHTSLPLTRFFGFPMSSLIARTAWDSPDAVIAEFKVKEYHFNNHQHLDAGAFQIHYRRLLAADSGLYRKYGSDHDINYHKRTIAHNAVLVHDPAETFLGGKRVNDGGQRWPDDAREPRSLDVILNRGFRTGRVTGRACGPAFSYLEGDLHEAYSAKVKAYERAFVFLPLEGSGARAIAVVLDRVTAARSDFKKTWLLHSNAKPDVENGPIVVRHPDAALVAEMLLPAQDNREIALFGGAGREYVVAGENHPPNPGTIEPDPWRVEVSPRTAAESDVFLAVLQVLDPDREPLAVERFETQQLTGARCGERLVAFSRTGSKIAEKIEFDVADGSPTQCLITGLAAGRWRAVPAGVDLEVSEEGGCAWFEAAPGRVVLTLS